MSQGLKSLYRMGPPKLVVSETSWRGIVIMVQSNFGIFDICSFVLNLVKLSRIIILYFQMGFQFSIESFFDANLRSFFLKELTFIQFDENQIRISNVILFCGQSFFITI